MPVTSSSSGDDKAGVLLIRYLECVASVVRRSGRYVSGGAARKSGELSSAQEAFRLYEEYEGGGRDEIIPEDRWNARRTVDWARQLASPKHQFRQLTRRLRIDAGLIGHAASMMMEAKSVHFRPEPPSYPRIRVAAPRVEYAGRTVSATLLRGLFAPPRPLDRAMTLGRSSTSHIRLESSTASRWHARILLDRIGWLIEDQGSTSGTFVNGEAVSGQQLLRDGDEVLLGEDRFYFAFVDWNELHEPVVTQETQFDLPLGLIGRCFPLGLARNHLKASEDFSSYSVLVLQVDQRDLLSTELGAFLSAQFPDYQGLSYLEPGLIGVVLPERTREDVEELMPELIGHHLRGVFVEAFDIPLPPLDGEPFLIDLLKDYLNSMRDRGDLFACPGFEELSEFMARVPKDLN